MNTGVFLWFNGLAGHARVVDGIVIFLADYLRYVLLLAFLIWVWRGRAAWKKRFVIPAVSAFVSRYIITSFIRLFYHHPRPFAVMQVHQLVPESGWSFPSGHAALFFALAAGIWHFDRRAGHWFFAAATIMGLARVIAGVHYPLDIVSGAVVGIITAWAVVSFSSQA